MKKGKFCSLLLVVTFFLSIVSVSLIGTVSRSQPSQNVSKEGWYYLPAYPNYAPRGLPDFDQRQDHWKASEGIWRLVGGLWSFCGPSCLAAIFWWFDSKHEDPYGYPGDGNSSYPLVRDLQAPSTPNPGPFSDDHNYNNVNDATTSWKRGKGPKELIEQLAWYCNSDYCRYPFIRGIFGTFQKYLENGARQWIVDAGLQDQYRIEAVYHPEFSLICDHIQQNDAVVVLFVFYRPHAQVFPTFRISHYCAVAGVNPDGYIALSDPIQNIQNPGPSPAEHNDAGIVSHDIYAINFSCPLPEKASWWIPQYYPFGSIKLGGLPTYALIISEIE
ncbi:MAG: hypothetical protein JXA75_00175 [Candidatus Thermoplasmatota archaeon]|nr:hypothetical protein [Candidatus Thermoplasmatota archaeon]